MADFTSDMKNFGTTEDPTRSELIAADRVKGTTVFNTAGDKIGHVEDIVLHKVSGRIAFAIMAFGGFLGIGERFHPIPWTMLDYSPKLGGYVVPMDRRRLEEAPTLETSQFGAADQGWGVGVATYYGVAPFWG
jgi:hypothetical protein